MSAKPILYYTPQSPPCRAVLLAGAEIGIEFDLREVDLIAGDHRKPEFLKINPQHTIPVVDDNGIILTDSHVICAYLADKYSKNVNLFPKELVARNNVMTLMYYDCGHIFPRLRMALEPVIFHGKSGISQDTIEYIQKSYDGLENYLTGNLYVCGKNLTIADLCCIASISTANDLAPIDKKTFPNLSAWIDRMSALRYYEKCNGEFAKQLKAFIDQKTEENKNK
ncbi:glutathione S-transferase 1-like [Episyrphus balteatus]|uniref:glutathione S-transferase 1-like n=1 Tax=Episyrphus balteatus TaxID=286459 RepID=UPI0024854983|nr:glutathione S-transferase 1-like [Episyrphus balteatus]